MSTATLPDADVQPEDPAPPRRWRWAVLVLVLALLAGGFAARGLWAEQKADIRSGTTLVDADGLAARYGVKVTLLAVTAAGGLVELRYQVVDPDKADALRHDLELVPAIVVEDTGATLVLSSLPHNHGETRLGGTYFFLFPNAQNALHAGTLVTLVVGDVRLEHVKAQG